MLTIICVLQLWGYACRDAVTCGSLILP